MAVLDRVREILRRFRKPEREIPLSFRRYWRQWACPVGLRDAPRRLRRAAALTQWRCGED